MARSYLSHGRPGSIRRGGRGVLLALLGGGLLWLLKPYLGDVQGNRATPVVQPHGTVEATVKRVVDGDTLLLADDSRVRLIGVDTPETVKPNHPVEPFGPEATAFTKQFLHGGQATLEFDKEKHDQYGRLLAYVWVGSRMLNEELLRAGLARLEPQYRFSAERKKRFSAAENEARAAGRGLWSASR